MEIMMAGPMVRRLLDGTKTQTRRVGPRWLKVKPGDVLHVREAFSIITCSECGGEGEITDPKHWMHPNQTKDAQNETWCLDCNRGERTLDLPTGEICVYRADGQRSDVARWTPAVHMPRELCRMHLVVKRVWQERADDISEADAIAEGMEGVTVDDLLEMARGSKRKILREWQLRGWPTSWAWFESTGWNSLSVVGRFRLVLAVLGAQPGCMVTAMEFEVRHNE